MIISSCDSCGCRKEFKNIIEQIADGWKSINNVVTCVSCRLKKLEDVAGVLKE